MGEATIRSATTADLPNVQECVDASYTKYIQRIGRRPAPMDANYWELISDDQVYVIVDDVIKGILVLVEENNALLIENIAVYPKYQGEGFGQRLMAFAEERAQQVGLRELHLYTNEKMTENIGFYTHLGFRETDRRTEDGFARVFMSKPVSNV